MEHKQCKVWEPGKLKVGIVKQQRDRANVQLKNQVWDLR